MNSLIASILLAILSAQAYAQTSDYCASFLCPTGTRNIGCGTKNVFASTCPRDAKVATISNFKNVILNEHNAIRNQVAMGNLTGLESGMRLATLQWDSELEKLATIQAKQCVAEKDECRNTDRFSSVGQNFYSANRTTIKFNVTNVILEAINSWFSEHESFQNSSVAAYTTDNTTSDFAQLITGQATYVGCSMVQYTEATKIVVNLFCDYSSEPKDGEPLYQQGCPAAQCVKGRNDNYHGLCAVNEPIDPNYIE